MKGPRWSEFPIERMIGVGVFGVLLVCLLLVPGIARDLETLPLRIPDNQLPRLLPPTHPLLQRAMSDPPTEVCASNAGDGGGLFAFAEPWECSSRSALFFLSRPSTSGSPGREYSYGPKVSADGWSIELLGPSFLGVSEDGLRIEGVPAEAGSFPVEVQVRFASGVVVAQRYALVIDADPPTAAPDIEECVIEFEPASRVEKARRCYARIPAFLSEPIVSIPVGRESTYRPRLNVPAVVTDVRPGEGDADAFDLEVLADSSGVRIAPLTRGRLAVWVDVRANDGSSLQQRYSVTGTDGAYLLGTDEGGRSTGALLLVGMRTALFAGLIAAAVGVALGLLLGALAGFYGGLLGRGVLTSVNALEAVPALLLILLAAVLTEFNLIVVMGVVGLVVVPEVTRTIASRVDEFRARQFVEAARELGLGDSTILWKEIVWYNLRPVLLAQVVRTISLAILMEVTISYFKLQGGGISWGGVLLQGKNSLGNPNTYWWLLIFPSLAIVGSVVGLRILENQVRRLFVRETGD